MLARFVANGQVGAGVPRSFAVTAACFTLAATTLAGGVLAQENLGAPSPPAGYQAPLHQLNLANPEPASAVPQAKKEGLAPFFADAKFGAQLKTYCLNRDKFTPDRSQAWALGGSLSALSGYLGPVRFGAVGYTSQKLYGPDDQDGTLLLRPGQKSNTVLGQAYAEVKFADELFGAIGLKEYHTPYINNWDVRMTPNTFQGATVYGSAGGKDGAPRWRYGGGYIQKIKYVNSSDFEYMSVLAGAPTDVKRGVYVAGANYERNNFSFGAIDYYSDDIINIFYTDAKYTLPSTTGYKLVLGAQYSNQKSTGDDLLTGSSFSTGQWGITGDLSFVSTTLTLAYNSTANGASMISPWGGYPGYTSVQVQDFDRAGENAFMVKAAYDFSRHGARGLSAYALAVLGSDVNAPNYNQNEYDFNVQWTPKDGTLKGSSFRIRYARVEQRGGDVSPLNDFRVIATYDF